MIIGSTIFICIALISYAIGEILNTHLFKEKDSILYYGIYILKYFVFFVDSVLFVAFTLRVSIDFIHELGYFSNAKSS